MASNPDPLYKTLDAAEYLNCSRSYLDQLLAKGQGPKCVMYGANRRYKKSELDKWIAEKTVSSTAESIHGKGKRKT